MTFADLVEEIYHRPLDEQIELREILEHRLRAARREEIYQNHLTSLEELKAGQLHFTSDVDELMRQLESE